MNKNLKIILIIAFLIAIIIAIIMYIRKMSNDKLFAQPGDLVKGYEKQAGNWVACNVIEYDKDNYQGKNSAGVTIYFKKDTVKLRTSTVAGDGQCADASTTMNVYTKK